MNSPAPGWLPDPARRHQYRYWDGARWTENVADGGVASTDPLGQVPPTGSDQSPTVGPTGASGFEPTQQVDPTRQYPGASEQPTPAGPSYSDYYGGAQGPPAPARKRPPTALIAALAVLAVALIGGLVYFLVRDDDDSSDNAAQVSDEDSATTDPEGTDSGDNDNGVGDSGSSDSTLPDDIDSEDVDQLVEFMADNMERASRGVLDHQEATCISQGLLDELGLERLIDIGQAGENPFTDPELSSQLFGIMEDCGVTLEDLATSPD